MGLLSVRHTANYRVELVAAFGALCLCACDAPSSMTEGAPPVMRRFTQEQYKHIIADVFGPDITIAGRMDPDVRKDGLLQIGATEATVTPGSLEQYDALARGIAAEVLAEKRRKAFMPCTPASPTAADPACAKTVLAAAGRLLFRRPLTDQELTRNLEMTNAAAQKLGDFYKGLEFGLASLMVSPPFLFQKDAVEPDPDRPGKIRLDAYSKASRVSFFLWNSAPDDILLTAAERGELNTRRGLERQADRMIASPRLKDGLRGFFSDFLQFSAFEALAKDPVIYPKFSQSVAADAQEQTLRTIVEHLVTVKGDYRDLFTTRKTYMSRALGVVYQVPVPAASDSEWIPYEFPADDPRAGLLTQLSFTAMYAHPGRSSPTLRGKAIREVFLCQSVPVPPVNVDFSQFENTNNPVHKTARERLAIHATDPACAGCHRYIDRMGVALENFDGLGAYRERENGALIDASGEVDGITFTTPAGLGHAMHENPASAACLVNKMLAYGSGRLPAKSDIEWVKILEKQFAADGYRVPELLRRIVTSDDFYRIAPAGAEAPAVTNATNESSQQDKQP